MKPHISNRYKVCIKCKLHDGPSRCLYPNIYYGKKIQSKIGIQKRYSFNSWKVELGNSNNNNWSGLGPRSAGERSYRHLSLWGSLMLLMVHLRSAAMSFPAAKSRWVKWEPHVWGLQCDCQASRWQWLREAFGGGADPRRVMWIFLHRVESAQIHQHTHTKARSHTRRQYCFSDEIKI